MKRRLFISWATSVIACSPVVGFAEDETAREGQLHLVEMRSEYGEKIFEPLFLRVEVGDTVRFINISGHHNTESIKGMIPDGVESWNSRIDKTFDLLITHEGVYGYKCTPHYQKGMVGLIVAGDASINLEQAKAVKTPTMAAELFGFLFSQASI